MNVRIFALVLCLAIAAPACSEEPVDSAADESKDVATAESRHVVMRKNPGCGCCDVWADHLRSWGFTVESTEDRNILDYKDSLGIPQPMRSCHTAEVDGYFIEGHVPAADILRLLKERPEHVAGLGVPQMPLGSPGMEHPRPQDFNTIALLSDGSAYVFESHEAGESFAATHDDH